MDKNRTGTVLQESQILSKTKPVKQGKLLNKESHSTYERFKPANIVKNIFLQMVTSPRLRKYITVKTADVAVVLLTSVILRKTTNSNIKRIIGTALVLGLKNLVSRKPEIVKKAGTGIMKIIFNSIANKNKNREYTYTSP